MNGNSGHAVVSKPEGGHGRRLFDFSTLQVFVFATAIGLLLTFVQSMAVGGFDGMLMVSERSDLEGIIENELGPVPRAPGSGHDGQMTFAIATDLLGSEVPPLLDHAGYRYRRILLPAVASGFGTIGGPALLWSLLAWNVLAFAAAAAAVVVLLRTAGRSLIGVLGVIANPGLWLSINLVTVDVMAAGLALTGLALAARGRHWWAVCALALSALTKDQYLVVALGLGLYLILRHRPRLGARYLWAAGPLLGWTLYLNQTMESAFSPRSNFGLPFVGVWESVQSWDLVSTADVAYGSLLIGGVIVGTIALGLRQNRQYWPIAGPWLGMAALASSWVWLLGNNALRSLAPVLVWTVFAIAPRNHIESPSPTAQEPSMRADDASTPRLSGGTDQ